LLRALEVEEDRKDQTVLVEEELVAELEGF
jgi:hypothetical protein